jgi:hypothetical protein
VVGKMMSCEIEGGLVGYPGSGVRCLTAGGNG